MGSKYFLVRTGFYFGGTPRPLHQCKKRILFTIFLRGWTKSFSVGSILHRCSSNRLFIDMCSLQEDGFQLDRFFFSVSPLYSCFVIIRQTYGRMLFVQLEVTRLELFIARNCAVREILPLSYVDHLLWTHLRFSVQDF